MAVVLTYIRKGESPSGLALGLSKKLNTSLFIIELDSFADTETKISFGQQDNIADQDVYLVWKFEHSKNINTQIFDLLLILTFLKKFKVKSTKLVLPYLPYCRQDSSSGLLFNFIALLKQSGINQIFTVDLHSQEFLKTISLVVQEIQTSKFWAKFIKINIGLSDIIIVSPDDGGKGRADRLAEMLGVETVYMTKERFAKDATRTLGISGNVDGKVAILIDDIVSTGGTAVDAGELLSENGAKSMFGIFTHGVLADGAINVLKDSNFDGIYIANTMTKIASSDKIQVVSIDSVLIEKLTSG